MKLKLLIYLCACLQVVCAYSCANASAKCTQEQNVQNDLSPLQEDYSIDELQGVWTEDPEQNALFFIIGDTLRYVENQGVSMRLHLDGDLLTIHGDLEFECKIVKLDADSLCYVDNLTNTITRLVRVE